MAWICGQRAKIKIGGAGFLLDIQKKFEAFQDLTCHNMKVQWFTDSCDICFISKFKTQEISNRADYHIQCLPFSVCVMDWA
jgi:hypothetical protein